ncbi:DUF488 family protein [Microbacterium sp. A1-JK]|uniref:DUF488 domain-containing protein n=1 Tax=Microbacterium sp. A1-JK TaxID=3177516 RepID=UPI00388974AD
MGLDVFGVGYEGLDLDGLVSKLRLRGVRTLVDVRLNPISRKRGLSKTALRTRLVSEDIGYRHLPALGNPRDNREGFADVVGPVALGARERFAALMETEAAHDALDEIITLSEFGTVALLCFEQDETRCHRELVISAVRERFASA